MWQVDKNQVQSEEVMTKNEDGYFIHSKAILINISPTYVPIFGSLPLVNRHRPNLSQRHRKIESLTPAIKSQLLGLSLAYNPCE